MKKFRFFSGRILSYCSVVTLMLLLVTGFSSDASASAINSDNDIYLVVGNVVDSETDNPLAGVNIKVKGKFKGTFTNGAGSFSLDVEADDVLVFSSIGYKTKEVLVNGQTELFVEMEEDAQELDELIVVGYGVQSRESLVGSISSVNSASIEQIPTSSFENSIQGNIAGVQLIANDGAPGANTQVRVRGIGSISASSEPLYVIDGVIMASGSIATLHDNGNRSTNVMTALNPNDIENITVLKDAASTAIYGSRGANGVILVTTKSGKTGDPRISIKSQLGFNRVASNSLLKPLNAEQYTTLFLEGYMNRGETQAEAQQRLDNRFQQLTDPSTGKPTNTDWLDELTRTGVNHSYDLSLSGGNEGARYFVSTNFFDQESHIIGNDFNRLASRANVDVKVNNKIDVSNKLLLSQTDQNGMTDGSAWANPVYNAFLLSPLIPVKNEAGLFNDQHKNYFPMGGNNPVGSLSGDDNRNTQQIRLNNSISAQARILDNLILKSQWNIDIIKVTESQYQNPRYGNGRNVGGYAQENEITRLDWTGTQTLNYIDNFNSVHNVEVLLGYEAQQSEQKSFYGYGQNFPSIKLITLSSAAEAYDASATQTKYTFASVFSRFIYDYDSRYIAQFSLRRDGSSRFGSDERWGNFYSIGLAWNMSTEEFLADMEEVDLLKLRTSYGTTGNAEIGNFPSRGLYGYGRDYDGSPGGVPVSIANPGLTWESQQNFNVALEIGAFEKLVATVEYFTRVSSDLLLNVPLSRTTGFDEVTQNAGELENKGFELTVDLNLIRKTHFSWDIGFNTTFIKNEVTKLTEAFNDGTKRREEGKDYQSYYLYDWAGVDPSNGQPLWYTDETRSATTSDINDAERFFIGKSATPDHYGGFKSSVFYKNFNFDAQFAYSWGNFLYGSQERFIHGDGGLTPRSTSTYAFENRWTPENPNSEFPQHKWGGNNNANVGNSSRWLHDGSYVRLRNVTIAYSFALDDITRFGLKNLRVYTRATNLFTWTRDSDLFYDPEQNINGLANSTTPAIKSITFGIDVGL
ncbi:MAG: TonB-dependent receptor [Balneola sp.]|nr:TonB-dependent receptor [Balneola sp.]MBO6650581.1 TonB-dependent receptor [Balneola sp.]MBO6712640.1 TonB-dependent receptor [Balneola sp.]MBO6800866.1 TonB-dependent receptor [Balneola sp.]MBO6870539.1 TonB-dependent receptor [Balneola sp.]